MGVGGKRRLLLAWQSLPPASFAIVLFTDARPAVLLAFAAPFAIVPADVRPAALLVRASMAIVLADDRPAALLALASLTIVLADVQPPHC